MPPTFKYNPDSRRYVDDKGAIISPRAIRDEVKHVVEQGKQRIREASESFRTDRNVAQWLTTVKDEVRRLHTQAAAAAHGGIRQLDSSQLGKLGADVKAQYQYLREFGMEVRREIALADKEGREPNFGGITNRSEMYADAAFQTYENNVLEREIEAGVGRVRWVAEADPCDGCANDAGEYDIEDVPEMGGNECLTRCRCHYEYVEAA